MEDLLGILKNLRVEILEPVMVKGYPKERDFKSLKKLADEILKKHIQYNLIKLRGG